MSGGKSVEQRIINMNYIFHPQSIAFVGATEANLKWGFIVFNNLISGGYEGKLYPVNPGRDKILGYKAYPSVREIPDDVDLAIFTIPAEYVSAAVDDCVVKGVKAGVIISAGFKEMGGKFIDIEAKVAAKALAGNMVLVGPNCNGISCTSEKLFPWFSPI
ncbi:MAG: CoA-binding protein, partial [Desulfobacterales bacterium]|nr:CoA-binding protein [Desulfobacterales bacterium]